MKKELRKYLDYDDILDVVATQFNNYPEILNWISSNYTDLLIDEFQDTNPLQWKLINPLVNKLKLFCVGDDAQSIYGLEEQISKVFINLMKKYQILQF